jgi:hypothetical protein
MWYASTCCITARHRDWSETIEREQHRYHTTEGFHIFGIPDKTGCIMSAYATKRTHGLLWYDSHKNTVRQKDLE